jgi:hypothetical protein
MESRTAADQAEAMVRYRLCRTGFAFASVACGVLAFDSAANVIGLVRLQQGPDLGFRTGEYMWLASSAVAWSAMIGSLFLVNRWSEPAWRRRTRGLIIAALLGTVLWGIRFADRLGFVDGESPHAYTAMHLSLGVRWLWLALLVGLAGDVAEHLGRADARATRALAHSLIMAGIAVWILLVLTETSAHAGMRIGRFPPRLFFSLWLETIGLSAIRCAASFLATLLALLAARECSVLLRELKSRESDAFGSVPPG